MNESNGAIGVMDSGVGGVSVLNALRRILPCENYVYMSDSKHAPYGRKTPEEVRSVVISNSERLILFGCKALVIACNTATAVAVTELRRRFSDIPVIGLEPAVRPALAFAREKGGSVLVLATDVTVRQERFRSLCEECCAELGGLFVCESLNDAVNHAKNSIGKPRVYALSVQDTVGFVEAGRGNSAENTEYLRKRLSPYRAVRFSAVVEGCTHFPFAEKSISEAIGYPVAFFDGAHGAARRLAYLLEKNKTACYAPYGENGWIQWIDTDASGAYLGKMRGFKT